MSDPNTPPSASPRTADAHRSAPASSANASSSTRARLTQLGRLILAIPTPLIFGVSVLIAGILLWRQGEIRDIGRAVRHADLGTVVIALVLYVAGLSLLCVRWHLLARMAKGSSDPALASEAFLTSVVINYAAPIGLAVPTRAALTKRALGLSPAQTGSVALWEIVSDVLVLGCGTLLWLAISDGAAGSIRGVATPGPVTTIIAIAAVISGIALVSIILARSGRLRERIGLASASVLSHPRQRPGDAGLVVGVTAVYWVAQGIVLALLLEAVGVAAAAQLVLGLISLPVLIGMLSPVPGGAGVREALMVAVANVQSANAAAVLVAAVTYRIALFAAIPVLYAGVRVWLVARRRGMGDG